MKNPPDLIVTITSEDHDYNKKKMFTEKNYQEESKQYDELLCNIQSNKCPLEYQLRQLRNQTALSHNNEFDEQSCLLRQRFQDEIQSAIDHHTGLVQEAACNLSISMTNVLRKSIEDIDSLRYVFLLKIIKNSILIWFYLLDS